MRINTCCDCKNTYESTYRSYRCLPCDREYRRKLYLRQKADGTLKKRARSSPERDKEYQKEYFARPEKKALKNEYMRNYRKRQGVPLKNKARMAAAQAIYSGKLVRQPCEVCGAVKVDAHHDDYSKPLDVRWLCPEHHRQLHKEDRQAATKEHPAAKKKKRVAWRKSIHGLPPGITPTRNAKTFTASLHSGGKKIYLGSFKTVELASVAYQEAAQRHSK